MSHSLFTTSMYDWVMVQDPVSKRMYYINLKTNETQWDPPSSHKPMKPSHKPMKPSPSKLSINDWTTIQNPNPKTKQTTHNNYNIKLDDNADNLDDDDDSYQSDEDVLEDLEYITLGGSDDEKLDPDAAYNETDDESITPTTTAAISIATDDQDIIKQLLQFGYNENQITSALEECKSKHIIYDINHVLEEIQSLIYMMKHFMDEYMVTFTQKPFGMDLSTLKRDKNNLYVRKVEANSFAARSNIKVGAKLIALNGENIEGIGSKHIFQRMKELELPLTIMFRKRKSK